MLMKLTPGCRVYQGLRLNLGKELQPNNRIDIFQVTL